MATSDMFPSDITAQEKAAGFCVSEVPNPMGHYAFSPKMVDAVVRALPDGKLAVKMAYPGGGVVYAIWTPSEKASSIERDAGGCRRLVLNLRIDRTDIIPRCA